MQIDMNRFRATFFVEAAEHIERMEASLLQLEATPTDNELLNTIFRAAHSIKGASTTFGFDEIGRFTHVLENLLDRLRDGQVLPSSELIELLLTSVDVMDGLVQSAKEGSPAPNNVEAVLAELNRVNGIRADSGLVSARSEAHSEVSRSQDFKIRIQTSRDFFRFGQDPSLLIRELRELGTFNEVKVDTSSLPSLAALDPESSYLNWEISLSTTASEQALKDVFMFLDEKSAYSIIQLPQTTSTSESNSAKGPTSHFQSAETSETSNTNLASNITSTSNVRDESKLGVGSQKQAAALESETVRVDRGRLDEMINQIGELVIGTSMVEQELKAFIGGAESVAMNQLAKIVRDLQEMSLSLRMVPIAATFQKLARIVRDLSRKLDKKIEFRTEGEDTELDKSVVDQIGDPLVHMVRNAADHGIETVAERVAAGKSEIGRVVLRAFQQGGNIFIEIEDDGRGLNRARILKKAIERGLVSESDNLSDSEVCNLIFLPGFSTADTITDVSGRGVGMDVVRRNVESLQGSVSIRSTEGKGSVLTVRLPLTLAILDGLLVQLDQEVYVVPLLSVVESICIQPSEIRKIVGVGEVILLRGELVPVVRLSQVLQMPTSRVVRSDGLLVIVEEQGRRFALVVDELLGQQQVVIKNLETNFQKVPGVAGATILGNGRVALILDLFGISSLASGDAVRKSMGRSERLDEKDAEDREVLRCLIQKEFQNEEVLV